MAGPNSAVKALQVEMNNIRKDPIEGVRIELQDDENMFDWDVSVFGPPKTLYEGGYFKVGIYVASSFWDLLQITVVGYPRFSSLNS